MNLVGLVLVTCLLSISSYASSIDRDNFTDVRLHKTQCDARWKFSNYMSCLDRSGLIPAVRASYLTMHGRRRFYKVSRKEGALRCKRMSGNQFLFETCINRFVAHKAQMLGSENSRSLNFSKVELLGTGSID